MAELKTKPSKIDPEEFIAKVEPATRREDARVLIRVFEEITGEKGVMWGPSIIGYGAYEYRYESGRTGTYLKTGFSPRKSNLVVYLISGVEQYSDHLKDLGPYKSGSSCLYLPQLKKINMDILCQLIDLNWKEMATRYG